MPSRQPLQKLRRHLNGLENWPMSSSYPQETGQEEARVMAKAIREKLQSDRVETTVTIQKESLCNPRTAIYQTTYLGISSERIKKHLKVVKLEVNIKSFIHCIPK